MKIEPLTSAHLEPTRLIFNYYVAHTNATPESVPRSQDVHARAVGDFLSAYVATDDAEVLGFAFAKPYAKGLESFDPAVEVGIYLRSGAGGHGIGQRLVAAVIGDMRSTRRHTAIAKIDADNIASIKMCAKLGFSEAARLRDIGMKNGKRVTVVYMQLML